MPYERYHLMALTFLYVNRKASVWARPPGLLLKGDSKDPLHSWLHIPKTRDTMQVQP